MQTIDHSDLVVYVETRPFLKVPGQLQLLAATPRLPPRARLGSYAGTGQRPGRVARPRTDACRRSRDGAGGPGPGRPPATVPTDRPCRKVRRRRRVGGSREGMDQRTGRDARREVRASLPRQGFTTTSSTRDNCTGHACGGDAHPPYPPSPSGLEEVPTHSARHGVTMTTCGDPPSPRPTRGQRRRPPAREIPPRRPALALHTLPVFSDGRCRFNCGPWLISGHPSARVLGRLSSSGGVS